MKSERFVEVFLYPDSKKAKQALDGVGADYYVVELDKRKDGSEIQDALAQLTGQRTVPNVFISGKSIGGGDDTVALAQSGKLKKLLEQANSLKA